MNHLRTRRSLQVSWKRREGLGNIYVLSMQFPEFITVGVWLGAERYAEEFGRFGTEECVLIGIFIHVS